MNYKFDYNIHSNADNDIFLKICGKICEKYPQIVLGKLLNDVDGSAHQIYYVDGEEIAVSNDYYIGAVYVKSNIDLSELFG